MQKDGLKPDDVTFISILKACASLTDLHQGKLVEVIISESGYQSKVSVACTLMDMYAKSGSIMDARRVFDRLQCRDVVTWNAMISGYAHYGHCQEALQLLQQMHQAGLEPDEVTFISILRVASLDQGNLIHACITESGLECNAFLGNTIIDMYAKCWSMEDAHKTFDRLPKQDVVTWNATISGYVQNGQCEEALQLFQQMQHEGMEPDQVTFVSILKGCSSMGALHQGKVVHAQISESCCELGAFIGSTLIEMYVKCKSVESAFGVFDKMPKQDVLIWNAMITGYVQCGQGQDSLHIFHQMQQKTIEPNQMTFVSVLKACSSLVAMDQGEVIHALVVERGFEMDVYVSSTLIDLYAKCGSIEDALSIFDELPQPGVVTWTAMIAGYVQHGHGQEALMLFQQMEQDGVEPNQATFVCILKACSTIAALDQGKLIHECILRNGFESDEIVGSMLVDMYAKCGSIHDACRVFGKLPKWDVIAWSVMIAGYAQHNDYKMALQLFEDMQQEGLQPDVVTFVSLLSACSHVGLMAEGCHVFTSMGEGHGIVPTVDHYNCMVDLLGRTGRLSEAADLLKAFPSLSDNLGWRSLLSHCQTHGDVKIAKSCFDHLVAVNGGGAASYTLMSNIYAHAGMEEDADRIENLRNIANVWKKPAEASIELDNKLHDFFVGDRSHPQSENIYAKFDRLLTMMKKEGYMP